MIFLLALSGNKALSTNSSINNLENLEVLPADYSQMEAIKRAKNGESFVLQGPPGCGKSQTITNIIGELIAQNKSVLFVCEKKAALDVVYKNLAKRGLQDFCLALHDPKVDKKDIIFRYI
ncbi:MAG: AAA family ATPase [Clostridium sp.]|nr:MAG: AAA family ATPase [Clostridium sp.]